MSEHATAVVDRQGPDATAARRSAIATMYTGLAATVLATVVPYADRMTSNTLADHIRSGYPGYTRARVDTAATIYLAYLSAVGAVGVAAWLWTIHVVKTDKRWARGAATAMFVTGTSVALADLLVKDTSGDTGLPPLLSWTGMLPCLPGLVAVSLLWHEGRPDRARRTMQAT